MDDLNALEISIFKRLSLRYSAIQMHLPYLHVESREITGVGMYINIHYDSTNELIEDINSTAVSISTNEQIQIPQLRYGLGYEVDIFGGRIKFIELITYGEIWDGAIEGFAFQ